MNPADIAMMSVFFKKPGFALSDIPVYDINKKEETGSFDFFFLEEQ